MNDVNNSALQRIVQSSILLVEHHRRAPPESRFVSFLFMHFLPGFVVLSFGKIGPIRSSFSYDSPILFIVAPLG